MVVAALVAAAIACCTAVAALASTGEESQDSAALWELRGSQATAAFYPSMFRVWPEFRAYVRAQAAFGTNQIEMGGAPVCDSSGNLVHTRCVDCTLCEASVAALVQFSTELHTLGMNVSFGWSLAIFSEHRVLVEQAFRQMPRVDSVFFPGGDGGSLVWADVESAAVMLRKYHPDAQVWVSAQEYNATELVGFFQRLSQPATQSFLSGVVVGPHWRIPTMEIVRRMPPGYLLRQYPDICHSMQAQYAIPDWHWAWQFTHGREAINPMPLFSERIVRLRGNGSTPSHGVGAYSEGVADDLNKAIWSGIAADPRQTAAGIVEKYAQYHFSAAAAPAMASALMGLEQNWVGDISTNQHIESTLLLLQAVERLTPPDEMLTNWRLQMYLYRGYYDAFVQARFRHEQQCEQAAVHALVAATATADPAPGIKSALVHVCCVNLVPGCPTNHTGAVPNCELPPAQRAWRVRVVELHAMLNASVGTEVVQRQTKDLNLVANPHANIDNPLNDAAHLALTLATILQLKSAAAQVSAIQGLLNRTDPGPGGFYEDFGGGGSSASHLIAGPGPQEDPAYYFSPLTQAWPAKVFAIAYVDLLAFGTFKTGPDGKVNDDQEEEDSFLYYTYCHECKTRNAWPCAYTLQICLQ
jgi:hypothetical protein